MKALSRILLAFSLAALPAFSASPALEGTWTSDARVEGNIGSQWVMGKDGSATYAFGTFSATERTRLLVPMTTMQGRYRIEGNAIWLEVKGKPPLAARLAGDDALWVRDEAGREALYHRKR